MSVAQQNMPYSWSASDAADRLKDNRLSYTPLERIDIDYDENPIVDPKVIGQMQRMLIIDDDEISDDEEDEEEDYTNLPPIDSSKQQEQETLPKYEHAQYVNSVRKSRPLPQIPQRTTSKELPKNMTEVFADSFKSQNKLTAQQLFEMMCNNRVDSEEEEDEEEYVEEELDNEEDYYEDVYAFKTQVPSPEMSSKDAMVYSPYHHYDHFNAHAYKMMTPVEEVDEEDQLYADYQFEEQIEERPSISPLQSLNLSSCNNSLRPQSEVYLSAPSLTSGCTSPSSCRSVEFMHRDNSECNDVEPINYYNEETQCHNMHQLQEECEIPQYQNPQQKHFNSTDNNKLINDASYFTDKSQNQCNDISEDTSLVSDVQRLSQLNQALMTPVLSNSNVATHNQAESKAFSEQTPVVVTREKMVPFNEYSTANTSSPLAMTSFSLTHDKEAIKTYRRMATKTHDKNVQFTYAKYLLQLVSLYNTNAKISNSSNNARDRLQEEAEYWVEKLAKGNYAEALYIKGQWHSHFLSNSALVGSQYKKVNHSKAYKCFQQAAKLGSIEAYYELAEYFQSRKEYKKAISSYRYAASKNHILSLYKLANILIRGLLQQEKDVQQGMIFLKRAADMNKPESARSAYDLACIYSSDFESIGMDCHELFNSSISSQTYRLAVKYFKIADSLGLTAATFRLGRIVEHGHLGTEANPREAFKYYIKAADKNHADAMLELSRLYKEGISGYLNPHPVMAHTWCIKASQSGNETAEYLMGTYYEFGVGVNPDYPRALEWYSKSASKGYKLAQEKLNNSSNNRMSMISDNIDSQLNKKLASRGGDNKKEYYKESIRIAEKSRKTDAEQNCQIM